MKCIECGEQPFGIRKLLRYQITEGNSEHRFKCDQCNAFLLKKEAAFSELLKRVVSIFAATVVAAALYIFISGLLFDDTGSYLWFAFSISYVAAFGYLAAKLDLKFIKFEKDNSTDPVMIMQIRKPGGKAFSAYTVLSIVLLYLYMNYIEPLFSEPLWGGVLFILFMGLLLAIGSYLLKFYSEKVPA